MRVLFELELSEDNNFDDNPLKAKNIKVVDIIPEYISEKFHSSGGRVDVSKSPDNILTYKKEIKLVYLCYCDNEYITQIADDDLWYAIDNHYYVVKD